MCVYPFITLVSCFVYFWCAGSVRIFLAGRVIYFLCETPLCGVPGRYNLFECLLGADGGTAQIFLFSGSCCSEHGTGEMVRGGGLFSFSLCLVFCYFFWRLDICGRGLCSINRFFSVDLWYFLAVSFFVSC